MEFMEAVKAMREGKRLKRESTSFDLEMDKSGEYVDMGRINMAHLEATDWKLVEEPETNEDIAKKLTVAIASVFVTEASPRQLEKAKELIEKELNTQSQ